MRNFDYVDYLMIALSYLLDVVVALVVFRIGTFLPLQNRQKKIVSGVIALVAFSLLYLSEAYIFGLISEFTNEHKELAQYGVGIAWWLSLAYLFNQLIRFFIWEGILTKNQQSIVPKLVRNLFDAIVYSIAFVLIVHFVFEKPANGIIAASSILTFILGIAARDSLATIFFGLSLGLNESLKKGDMIAFNNITGQIIDMDWRSVTVRTLQNTILVIPNNLFANTIVTNLSKTNTWKMLEVNILQSYEHSPQRVKDLLLKSAKQSFLVLKDPVPQASISKYEKEGIRYTLQVYTSELEDTRVVNEVLSIIWYAFYREGIDWDLDPSTQIIPHLQIPDDKTDEEVVRHVAILKNKGIFTALNERELTALIANAKKSVYGPPEQIVKQGDEGSSLFYVAEGKLEVMIDQEDGAKLKVAELKNGDIFGEMALLTGQKRTATVLATTEVALFEISKEIILPVIEHRREILNDMSLLLAKREVENYLKKLDYKDQDRDRKLEEAESKFMQLINQFFGR
jgi:small-conductance mechanosensitive channel